MSVCPAYPECGPGVLLFCKCIKYVAVSVWRDLSSMSDGGG